MYIYISYCFIQLFWIYYFYYLLFIYIIYILHIFIVAFEIIECFCRYSIVLLSQLVLHFSLSLEVTFFVPV